MKYLDSYQKFNEGWKEILATALVGLTTACQKVEIEDELGHKLYSPVNGLAQVTFVDSLSTDKFRVEAKFKDGKVVYFDNPLKLDTGQTIYLHSDDIGRLLATPVGPDFVIPEEKTIDFRVNSKGELSNLRGSKVKINSGNQQNLLDNLKQMRQNSKSKYLLIDVNQNGDITNSKEIKSTRGLKLRLNQILLKGSH